MREMARKAPVLEPAPRPWFTVAVLTWGDHLDLVQRCLRSLWSTLPNELCEIVVAANAPSQESRHWLEEIFNQQRVDRLLLSERNLYKCPMLGHVLNVARGDYLWWFDDDSHVTDPGAFARWWEQVQASSPRVVGWGATAIAHWLDGFADLNEARQWVTQASWFRGLEPPGGPAGPEDWWFLTGGSWWMRVSALRALLWPDPRLQHVSEDILLGEAIRQQGWHLANVIDPGVAFSDAPRRGDVSGAKPSWDAPV
jgi:hypothetical protein